MEHIVHTVQWLQRGVVVSIQGDANVRTHFIGGHWHHGERWWDSWQEVHDYLQSIPSEQFVLAGDLNEESRRAAQSREERVKWSELDEGVRAFKASFVHPDDPNFVSHRPRRPDHLPSRIDHMASSLKLATRCEFTCDHAIGDHAWHFVTTELERTLQRYAPTHWHCTDEDAFLAALDRCCSESFSHWGEVRDTVTQVMASFTSTKSAKDLRREREPFCN